MRSTPPAPITIGTPTYMSLTPYCPVRCAAHLTGQYGVDDLYVGVPCVIGAGGVERIVEIELDAGAQENFNVSVEAVKELLVACKQIDNSLAEEAVA